MNSTPKLVTHCTALGLHLYIISTVPPPL